MVPLNLGRARTLGKQWRRRTVTPRYCFFVCFSDTVAPFLIPPPCGCSLTPPPSFSGRFSPFGDPAPGSPASPPLCEPRRCPGCPAWGGQTDNRTWPGAGQKGRLWVHRMCRVPSAWSPLAGAALESSEIPALPPPNPSPRLLRDPLPVR